MRTGTMTLAALMAMLSACGQNNPPVEALLATAEPAPASIEQPPDTEKPTETMLPAQAAIDSKEPARPPEIEEIVSTLKMEIAERDALATRVFQAGVAIDGYTSAGTAFNEIDIPEHSCVVLGRLLGKSDLVKTLEISYAPDFSTRTTENASDLRIMSNSLHNFASVARHVLEMSHDERVVTWNLDCAGKLGLPKDYIRQEGASSFYVIINDGKALKVLGDIEAGFAQKIIDAIEANPRIEVVALGSGGGLVYEALKAGEFIRQKGLDTTLFNNCYSACPLVFMAGVQRQSWSPYPELGFHQISTASGEPVPFDSDVYRDIFHYLARMGVEPRFVLQQMWSAPPHGMTDVNGSDDALCTANITTWIQRGCTSRDYKSYEERGAGADH